VKPARKSNETSVRAKAATYVLLFIFLIAVFLLTPFTGDDLSFYGRLQRILAGEKASFMSDYYERGGRLVAAFASYFTLYTPLVSAFVRASLVLGILWATARLAGLRSAAFLPLVLLLILFPSVGVFRQAIAFNAGFMAHAAPVFFILLILVVLQEEDGKWRPFALLGLGIISSLFVETVTIFLALFSLAYLIFGLSNKRLTGSHLSLISGSALGSLIMFMSPEYRRIAAGETSYYNVPVGGGSLISRLTERLAETAPELALHFAIDMAPLWILVALVVTFSAWPYVNGHLAPTIAIGVMLGVSVVLFSLRQIGHAANSPLASTIVLVSYALMVIAAGGVLFSRAKSHWRIASLWIISGAISVMPLLVILPFGPRNFFIASTFFLIGTITLSAPLLDRLAASPGISVTTFATFALVAIALISVLSMNKQVNNENRKALVSAYLSGDDAVELRDYPFPSLVHSRNPSKILASLQYLECGSTSCSPVRSMKIKFK